MTVEMLIVRMVAGAKMEERFGPRGGFKGYFIGGVKMTSRTFSAARRNGYITRVNKQEPLSATRIEFKLTEAGAIQAEILLAKGDYYGNADIMVEHHFTHLVPGLVIYYGYMMQDLNRGLWIAAKRYGGPAVAKGVELSNCVDAARIAMRPPVENATKPALLSRAEAERIREGSDNPAAIQARMDAVANARETLQDALDDTSALGKKEIQELRADLARAVESLDKAVR